MRRSTALLVVLGILAVTALWWLFLVQPRRTEITDLRDRRDAAELEVERLRGEKAQLMEIQENELSYMTAGAALERLIPPTPELAQFIDDVTLLALDSGVELLTLTPSLPTAEPFADFASVTVFMEVDGQFFEVLGFLYGLADMQRLVRVDGVTLSPSGGEETALRLNAGVDASIFTTAIPVELDIPPEEGAGGDETTTTTTVPGETTTTTVPGGDQGG